MAKAPPWRPQMGKRKKRRLPDGPVQKMPSMDWGSTGCFVATSSVLKKLNITLKTMGCVKKNNNTFFLFRHKFSEMTQRSLEVFIVYSSVKTNKNRWWLQDVLSASLLHQLGGVPWHRYRLGRSHWGVNQWNQRFLDHGYLVTLVWKSVFITNQPKTKSLLI